MLPWQPNDGGDDADGDQADKNRNKHHDRQKNYHHIDTIYTTKSTFYAVYSQHTSLSSCQRLAFSTIMGRLVASKNKTRNLSGDEIPERDIGSYTTLAFYAPPPPERMIDMGRYR